MIDYILKKGVGWLAFKSLTGYFKKLVFQMFFLAVVIKVI